MPTIASDRVREALLERFTEIPDYKFFIVGVTWDYETVVAMTNSAETAMVTAQPLIDNEEYSQVLIEQVGVVVANCVYDGPDAEVKTVYPCFVS